MSIRDLTNNPWFISALSATAVLYLVFSVVMPLVNSDDQLLSSSGEPVPPADLFDQGIAAAVTPSQELGTRHALGERKNIQWLDDVSRDPFQKILSQPVTRTTNERRATKRKLPKLTALFVGNGIEAAVLNDQLVNKGDEVNGYTVTKIEPRKLQLQRNQRTYWVEPGND